MDLPSQTLRSLLCLCFSKKYVLLSQRRSRLRQSNQLHHHGLCTALQLRQLHLAAKARPLLQQVRAMKGKEMVSDARILGIHKCSELFGLILTLAPGHEQDQAGLLPARMACRGPLSFPSEEQHDRLSTQGSRHRRLKGDVARARREIVSIIEPRT